MQGEGVKLEAAECKGEVSSWSLQNAGCIMMCPPHTLQEVGEELGLPPR